MLGLTQAELQKLVTQINEHCGFAATAQGKLEDLAVEMRRRIQIAKLKNHIVNAYGTRARGFIGHGNLY